MCGRFELHTHPAVLALLFGTTVPPDIKPRYNIAPSTQVPIIRLDRDGRREVVLARWGFVPSWAKEPGRQPINARAETVATTGMFRSAFAGCRCLVPADGFYEWRALAGTAKQPYRIGMLDDATYALGGVWSRWTPPAGEPIDTFAIITTAANELMAKVHERMPVIIAPEDYERWLDPRQPVQDLLQPYPAELMKVYPVSLRVNRPQNDDPTLLDPLPGK
jgi:putative SOS response-associated peptidase YedK